MKKEFKKELLHSKNSFSNRKEIKRSQVSEQNFNYKSDTRIATIKDANLFTH